MISEKIVRKNLAASLSQANTGAQDNFKNSFVFVNISIKEVLPNRVP